MVAYITDSLAIRRILGHLDLSPPEKPPPDIRDVLRVPVDEEGLSHYVIAVEAASWANRPKAARPGRSATAG